MTRQAGPEDAESLARLYGPLVYKAAFRVLGDAALAEDAQQEVFLRLLQKPRSGVDSWPAYLRAASTRIAIDMLRSRQRWWRVLSQWITQTEDSGPSAEYFGIRDERAMQLRNAIARLPGQQARCFGMRYLEGMELGEIASALDITANHVGVVLHRARRRLEAQLREPSTEDPR